MGGWIRWMDIWTYPPPTKMTCPAPPAFWAIIWLCEREKVFIEMPPVDMDGCMDGRVGG